MSQSHSNSTLCVQVRVVNVARDLKRKRFKFGLSDPFFLNCKVPTTADFQVLTQVQVFNCVKSVTTPVLPLPQSLTETQESADLCRDASSSQADGVGTACGVVNGRAGGLRHSPFIPNLLPVVTAPESHCDIIVLGYGDGLFKREEDGEP